MKKYCQAFSIQFFVLFFVLIVSSISAQTPEFNPFITTWKTDNVGVSGDNQIRIPMIGNGYDFTVDWGDGSAPEGHAANPGNDVTHFLEHTYASAGTYTVSITGDFPRIYINDEGDRLKILTIDQWGDIAWSSMQGAFNGAALLTYNATDAPDLSGVTNMAQMFRFAVAFNGDIGDWDVSSVTSMHAMFFEARAFNRDIDYDPDTGEGWDVSNVTDMRQMFQNAVSFNGDIGGWDVSSVINMSNMFLEANVFNQDIGGWNVSNVLSMSSMFFEANAFNQDLSEWDVSKVISMRYMFFNAHVFNQDLSDWEVNNVTDMEGMFFNAHVFNQDIGGWNVGNVLSMSGMFYGANAFNQDLSEWDVSNVTDMRQMFLNAVSFNGDISSWEVNNVTEMNAMFFNAQAFNQDIGGWNISNAGSMISMLSNSGLSTENYDNILIGWAAQTVQNGVNLGAEGLAYCNGETARQSLISDDSWTITGDAISENCSCPATNNILYVKKGETGTGASWADALGELRDVYALFDGEGCTTGDVEEIWVAAGTYLPTDNTSDRTASFSIIDDVDFYGGFEGINSETSIEDRDWETHVTILSGDVDDDESLDGNSYHVVTAVDNASETILDGFTITGGNADFNDGNDNNHGGGLYVNNGTLTVKNVVVDDNFAENNGGGAFVKDSEGQPVFMNVTFTNNESNRGGGLATDDSSPTIEKSLFMGNIAAWGGGAEFSGTVDGSEDGVLIINSEFTDNTGNTAGGAVSTFQGNVSIINSVMSGNEATGGTGSGGGINNQESEMVLRNVLISGNSSANVGGGISFLDTDDALIINSTITGNESQGFGGGVQIINSSPAVQNSIVWNNDSVDQDFARADNFSLGTGDPVISYSLIEGCKPGGTWDGACGTDGGNNHSDEDPLFDTGINPGDAPSTSGDFSLTSVSPVINIGNNTLYTDSGGDINNDLDLAGEPRLFEGNTDVIDLGAYEFQGEPDGEEPEFAPFITTWEVEEGDLEIAIPMIGNGYDFNIDWGDGNEEDYNTNPGADVEHQLEHTYASAGEYEVKITGNFPRIYFYNADDRDKILTVKQWGDIEWSSMERAFNGASNLNITATDAPDLSLVESMRQMFNLASSVNADLNHWDTSNITDMYMAFRKATQFNGNIGDWETGNVTDMSNMFIEAEVFNQDIGGWDVREVTDMAAMFREAKAFNQNIGSWNTLKVTRMSNMFRDAENFNHDISLWETGLVESMASMFYGAASFNQDISDWNTGSLESAFQMFRDATDFNQDLGGWNLGAITVLEDFESTSGLGEMLSNSGLSTEKYDATLAGWAAFVEDNEGPENIVLGAVGLTYCSGAESRQFLIDDYNWTFTGDAISETCGEFTPFITTWKTDNDGNSDDQSIRIPMIGGGYDFTVDWGDGSDPQDYSANSGDDVTHLLEHTYASVGTYTVSITGNFPRIYFLNADDQDKILTVEQWGDIEWTSMQLAFHSVSNMNIVAEDSPDLSNVENMAGMFRLAVSMNGDINHWNTENITDMNSMFRGATSFNQDLDNWNTGSVTSMEDMFNEASAFNGDVSTWDTGEVLTMREMFKSATVFNGDLSLWQTGNVTTMNQMFDGATAFNGDISDWDVRKVTQMGDMFENAISFNQDISGWKTESLVSVTDMFRGATSFNQDISGWDISGVTSMTGVFRNATSFNQDLSGWDISQVTRMPGIFENSGMSTQNYDATLIGWAALAGDSGVQSEVELGAAGLTYCAGANARDILMGGPHNWEITGDALSETCGDAPVGEDQRVLAANNDMYTFSGSDFGLAIATYSVKIESLPANSSINRNIGDELTVAQLSDGALTYDAQTSSYGYGYDSFEFTIVDGTGTESEESYTMTIDLGSAFAELSGSQGWRFMSNPSAGDSYSDLFSGITVQTNTPSSQTLYELDQENYEWDPVGSTGDEPGVGTPFIIYVLEEDLPTTVESGDNWYDLDGGYSFSGLDYDAAEDEPNPDDFYLLGNPHPIALNFCQFMEENIATSAYFWDPEANGGNGDYLSLNCAAPEDVLIAPFQAFWVRTTDANPALSIPESAYLGGSEEGYFKQPGNERSAMSKKDIADLGQNLSGLTLTVQSEDGVFTNTARILFSDQATTGLDAFDAPKLSAAGLAERWLSFYSLGADGRSYAFQSLPKEFEEKVSIPLDIETTEAGKFTLNWLLPESSEFAASYYLRDNQTSEVIELREGVGYRFEIAPDQTSKVSETLEVLETAAAFFTQAEPRFELLVTASGVDGFTELGAIPGEFELAQNYPNPFNPATVISYQLPASSEVRLEVYDMLGRRVASLVEGHIAAGRHTVNFDASGLSSGVYLYRLQAGSYIMTKKLTVVK